MGIRQLGINDAVPLRAGTEMRTHIFLFPSIETLFAACFCDHGLDFRKMA